MTVMSLFKSFDASTPPPSPVAGCAAVLGYIGGNTPHVWTVEEWNAASGGGKLRQAPIWVADLGAGGRGQGLAAATKAAAMGWSRNRAIILDMEDWHAGVLVRDFIAAVNGAGYAQVTYGSQSSVFGNPADEGYWVAKWDGQPIVNGLHVVGHQYAADVPVGDHLVDLSVWEHTAVDLFGYGLRR